MFLKPFFPKSWTDNRLILKQTYWLCHPDKCGPEPVVLFYFFYILLLSAVSGMLHKAFHLSILKEDIGVYQYIPATKSLQALFLNNRLVKCIFSFPSLPPLHSFPFSGL